MENLPTTFENLKQVSTGLEAFEKLKSELEAAAKESKSLDLPNLDDKEQYKIIVEQRKKLKNMRIPIEKQSKAMRDLISPIVKNISEKEKELVSIISIEEKRLQDLENKYDNHQQELRRKKEEEERNRINNRISKLRQVNHEHDYPELVAMSDDQFEALLLEATKSYAKELEMKRIEAQAAEEKKRIEAEALEKQKAELEAELKRVRLIEEENKKREQQLADEAKAFAEKKAAFEKYQKEMELAAKEELYQTRISLLLSICGRCDAFGNVVINNNYKNIVTTISKADLINNDDLWFSSIKKIFSDCVTENEIFENEQKQKREKELVLKLEKSELLKPEKLRVIEYFDRVVDAVESYPTGLKSVELINYVTDFNLSSLNEIISIKQDINNL